VKTNMILCAHLKCTSLNIYQSKKTSPTKVVKKNVISNIYFPPVLHYSRQELLHCLIAQKIRVSNRLNVPNSIMFTFPFSYPSGRTSTMLYTGWSNCVYITGGSTPTPAVRSIHSTLIYGFPTGTHKLDVMLKLW
jgi:hypothetical protein